MYLSAKQAVQANGFLLKFHARFSSGFVPSVYLCEMVCVSCGTENTVNPRLEVNLSYKSTSIRAWTIGGSVQALIIGKSLNPSKLPYLDHYGLGEIKTFALEIIIFEIPLMQV